MPTESDSKPGADASADSAAVEQMLEQATVRPDGPAAPAPTESSSVEAASEPASVSVDEASANLPIQPGEHVADVEVVELLATGGGVASWLARRQDGSEATVHALTANASDEARHHFLAVASDLAAQLEHSPIEGMLKISSVDPLAGAYVGDIAPLGTVADLPVLNWDAQKQFEFLCHLCDTVQRMHAAGIVHGCLRPESVLLDGDLQPVVADTQGVDIATACQAYPAAADEHRAYTAPEVRTGRMPDERSDVYSLGRMLHYMLIGADPAEADEEIPRLDALSQCPPGLVRIVRKCTTVNPDHRYADAAALRIDLDHYAKDEPTGLNHPEIDDLARFAARPAPGERLERGTDEEQKKLAAARREAIRAREQAIKGKKSPGLLAWTQTRGIIFAVLGLALIVGTTVAAYFTGLEHHGLFAGSVIGSILLGLAPPGFGKNRLLSRALNVALALTAVWLGDPATYAAKRTPRFEGLKSANLEERLAKLRELRSEGEDTFFSINLDGADLSKMDFTNATLDSSTMRGANCRDADFSNASLLNVDVTNANFVGAELDGINPSFLIGWEQAKCDSSTTMPATWECRDGFPSNLGKPAGK